jgi:hypothetical protein
MKMKIMLALLGLVLTTAVQAQYWQQRAEYEMEIDFDVTKHQFEGTQNLVYYNNSPDTLHSVFYHLYYNAFQPGSMMDVRSRTIPDPDRRVKDRIFKLKPEEEGYHKINELKQNGQAVEFVIEGTILEVKLNKPIMPGKKAQFDMKFSSQVPLQIRRTGRMNKEGIDYSMTQWYPKMAEYDLNGWHSNPYIGREFHGVWADFDVKITIQKDYVIGGTGYLQNPQEIGHGYEDKSKEVKAPEGDELTWHFVAPKVHDFAWAADPDYKHTTAQVTDGPLLHFFFQTDTLVENWDSLPPFAVQCFELMNERFGKYPYEQYSVIQGGDGGMEYPMATLITSHGSMRGLISVTVHESIHSWYQGLLATNESKFPWMDEGFTTYAQYYVLTQIYKSKTINPYGRSYGSYASLARSGKMEPLTTHADHYHLNSTYGISAYSRGAVFLHQLSYVVGQDNFDKGMLRYFHEWKYKHPTADDFKRVMEKQSGLELDWYFENWIGTTNYTDYSLKNIISTKGKTNVIIERKGEMPMPLDVIVTLKNGKQMCYYIPLRVMRGEKGADWYLGDAQVNLQKDWPWTFPMYELQMDHDLDDIVSIVIDPSGRMADVYPENNVYPFPAGTTFGQ